jgi:glutamyl-tRNA reductase
MVVGEREIAGQVKRALEIAREDETTSKTLELLFQTASRTSKQVGSRTTLGAAGRSIVALGLDLASEELPPWRALRAVLIGTGSYAGASVAALRSRGCEDIRVYSRSGREGAFAASHDVAPAGDLVEALADADLVVSCSGARGRRGEGQFLGSVPGPVLDPVPGGHGDGSSPRHEGTPAPEASLEYVLDAAAVVRARERAAVQAGDEPEGRPLVILDLALHRDVDPRVADVEGVLLYDLSTLKANAPATARAVVDQARGIVDEAARRFEDTRLGRAADAAVVALLDQAEVEVRSEVERAVERLSAELATRGEGPEDADVEAIARDVRRRVHARLHDTIVAVRADALAKARASESAVVEGAEALVAEARGARDVARG